MKKIFVMTLLATGFAGNVFVYGQYPAPGRSKWDLPIDSIRILKPDGMPCLVTDAYRIEPMPVKKSDLRLVRPMPNGIRPNVPRVRAIPLKKEE
jgi:hypothetical protein